MEKLIEINNKFDSLGFEGYKALFNFLSSLKNKRYFFSNNICSQPYYTDDEGTTYHITAIKIEDKEIEVFLDNCGYSEVEEKEFWSDYFQEDFADNWEFLFEEYRETISEIISAIVRNEIKNLKIKKQEEKKLGDVDIIL